MPIVHLVSCMVSMINASGFHVPGKNAYIVMAYIVMACVVMAYIVMAYVVMAR